MEFANRLLQATGKGHLSYSAIKYAADGSKSQDMKLFELYMLGKLKKESPALAFGSLYDCMLLEPEKLKERFVVIKDDEIVETLSLTYKSPRSTKQYKEWLDEYTANVTSTGLSIVSSDDWDVSSKMVERLRNSEVINHETGEVIPVSYYLGGTPQFEINSWIGEVPIRGFLDVYSEANGFITDSKSTRSIHSFRYDVGSFCYDIQAYIYREVMGVNDFYWVVQEKSSPYLCGVYKASERTLIGGEKKFWSGISNINKWLDSGSDANSFALYGEI